MADKVKDLRIIWEKSPVDYYEKGVKENVGQKLWHENKFFVIKRIVEGITPKNVLDIGCHSGDMTARLSQLFPEARVLAIDVYVKAITCAKKKYPQIKFLVADGQNLPFKDKEFDLITCLETLEHVVSPEKTLKEIKRCLKDKGKVVVSMDSGSGLFNFIWFFWTRFGRGKVWHGSHLSKFNRQKLRKLIEKSGFVVTKEIVSHLGMAVTFFLQKE